MTRTNLLLGTSGWYYNDWPGVFYPEKLPKAKWLNYYSTRFRTVEVNNTFYRWPRLSTIEGWRDKTGPDFRLTLKGNKQITHTKKLVDAGEEVQNFYNLAGAAGDKLGCILWQLPPSLRRDDERLEAFCKTLSPEFRNVIEFRHASWWTVEVYDILSRYKVCFCMVSSPNLPEQAVRTANFTYLRFHGLAKEWYKYDYSTEELQPWAERLKRLDAEEDWVYFNNTFYGNAIGNAEEFTQMVSAATS